jgi:hypothetical protein
VPCLFAETGNNIQRRRALRRQEVQKVMSVPPVSGLPTG